MSKITHVIVELNMPIDTKWFRPDINDEYWGEGKPLIMCKDCRFRDKDGECAQFYAYTSAAGDAFSPPDWFFCGYGKRKEE